MTNKYSNKYDTRNNCAFGTMQKTERALKLVELKLFCA